MIQRAFASGSEKGKLKKKKKKENDRLIQWFYSTSKDSKEMASAAG